MTQEQETITRERASPVRLPGDAQGHEGAPTPVRHPLDLAAVRQRLAAAPASSLSRGEVLAVLAAADELEEALRQERAGRDSACATVAAMHAAAVGEVRGPTRGVVEDVADVRASSLRAEEAMRSAIAGRQQDRQTLSAVEQALLPAVGDHGQTEGLAACAARVLRERNEARLALVARGEELTRLRARLAELERVDAEAAPRSRVRLAFLRCLEQELEHAYATHGRAPWGRSEFYGVLLEEVDELWDAIKANAPDARVEAELIQVAAMCLRYVEQEPTTARPSKSEVPFHLPPKRGAA
jgi:hypothetical protein